MNNSRSEKPLRSKPTRVALGAGSIQKSPARQERWQNLQSHLNEALNQWNEVSVETKGKKSPDEERLNEVKGLLESLKSKLDQF